MRAAVRPDHSPQRIDVLRIRLLTSFVAAVLWASPTQAMPLQQYLGLAKAGPQGIQKASEYVADLVQTAEKSLTDVGRGDDAKRVSKLFTTNAPNSNVSIGMSQFFLTLALVNSENAKHNEESDVSDVLSISLQMNDKLKLPDSFFKLADALDKKSAPPERKK